MAVAKLREVPPHSEDIERLALGILVSEDAKGLSLLQNLDEEMFYRPYHQKLFHGIRQAYEECGTTDVVTATRYVAYLRQAYPDCQPVADLLQFQQFADDHPTIPEEVIKTLDRYRLQRIIHHIQLEDILPDPNVQIDNILSSLALARRKYMKPATSMEEAVRKTLEDFDKNIPEITTGIVTLDRHVAFRQKSLVLLGARPSGAKGLALDTPIPTPTGWSLMRDLKVGDEIFAGDGTVTKVTLVTAPKFIPCYRVTFSDGESIVADEEHLWSVSTRRSRKSQQVLLLPKKRDSKYSRDQRALTTEHPVLSTKEMAQNVILEKGGRRKNYAVNTCGAIQLPDAPLPIDPYILGVWLGDGDSCGGGITTADDEIFDNIRKIRHAYWVKTQKHKCGKFRIEGLTKELRLLGVQHNKHIPALYLRASEEQRRALLAGLLDTDGTVARHSGATSYCTTSRKLMETVHELMLSLGYRVSCTERRVRGATEASSIAYGLAFVADRVVFRLTRKAVLQKTKRTRSQFRYISSIEEIPQVLTRCIKVDHPSETYLASRSFIPTHNTLMATNIAIGAAMHGDCEVLIHAMEMDDIQMTKRMMSRATQIENWRVQRNLMKDEERQKIADVAIPMSRLPIWIREEDGTWPQHLAAYEMLCELRPKLKMIVVDYIGLIYGIPGARERHLQIATVLRQLKLFAKRRNICVLALSQLNRRAAEKDTDEPELEHFRESGCLTGDTLITDAKTGAGFPIRSLVGKTDFMVAALHDDWMIRSAPASRIFPSGKKETFRLSLGSGRVIRATANHPFLLPSEQWVRLDHLRVGERIAFVGNKLGREILGSYASWDEVIDISPTGEMEETYDITVPGAANFVANGIVVHNSAEQDADVAILLHAPQRAENLKQNYDGPEELRALVKKHRDGRLGKYGLYLDRRYGLVKDMPQGGITQGLEDEQFAPSTAPVATPVETDEIDISEAFLEEEDLELGV